LTIAALAGTVGVSMARADKADVVEPLQDLAAFRQASLNKHNEYRELHGVPALQPNKILDDSAQEYAEELAQKNEGKITNGGERYFEHSDKKARTSADDGENLTYSATTETLKDASAVATNAVEGWYNEIKDYNFKTGKHLPGHEQKAIGHFTQVVWKGSTELGCGAATTPVKLKNQDGELQNATAVFVVCRYAPGGNITISGHGVTDEYQLYKENVLPKP